MHQGDNKTADEGGDDLGAEHDTGRDLHVVTELEICGETNSLVGTDVGDTLEDHVCNGLSGKNVTCDHLVDDLESDLLVRDGLEHADGDGQECRNEEGEEECPDRELGWEDLDSDDHEDEGKQTQCSVPKVGYLGIGLHETRVNVPLILKRTAEAATDIATVPDEGMDDD